MNRTSTGPAPTIRSSRRRTIRLDAECGWYRCRTRDRPPGNTSRRPSRSDPDASASTERALTSSARASSETERGFENDRHVTGANGARTRDVVFGERHGGIWNEGDGFELCDQLVLRKKA